MIKKIHFFTLSAFIFGVFCLSLQAQEGRQPQSKYYGSVIGKIYTYNYTAEDFADTPSWNIEAGEPPLSVGQAIKIARENLPRFIENAGTWNLKQIRLQTAGNAVMAAGGDKWYYDVSFIFPGDATRQFSIIVKMDGKILEPKKVEPLEQ